MAEKGWLFELLDLWISERWEDGDYGLKLSCRLQRNENKGEVWWSVREVQKGRKRIGQRDDEIMVAVSLRITESDWNDEFEIVKQRDVGRRRGLGSYWEKWGGEEDLCCREMSNQRWEGLEQKTQGVPCIRWLQKWWRGRRWGRRGEAPGQWKLKT